MLKIKGELCLGCGLCAQNCPLGAISIQHSIATIDRSKCKQCHICIDVCPQQAILDLVPVSFEDLSVTLEVLKQKTNEIINRIENLEL